MKSPSGVVLVKESILKLENKDMVRFTFLIIILVSLTHSIQSFSQLKDKEYYVAIMNEGVKMMDNGEYEAADAQFKNVLKNVEVLLRGEKVRLNKAEVLIVIDGFIESHWHDRFFTYRPIYWFMRALFDKYIWKIHTGKYVVPCQKIAYDLHKELKGFFKSYQV